MGSLDVRECFGFLVVGLGGIDEFACASFVLISVGSRWAACMVGSFALVSRNKYQSFAQKVYTHIRLSPPDPPSLPASRFSMTPSSTY